MGTVFLTPAMQAFVEWNRSRGVTVPPQPVSTQEAFEAGFRAGYIENVATMDFKPKRKARK